jgi:formate dehydrogenase iron-sulfur subunit
MCYQKLRSGELREPACTKACPTQATIFGEREALLSEARKRIQEQPGKYVHRIWGEKEVGGTGVLYLSDISLDFLTGQKELPEGPLPEKVFKVLKGVPPVFVGVGLGMYGLYWIIKRRQRLMGQSGASPQQNSEPTSKETK